MTTSDKCKHGVTPFYDCDECMISAASAVGAAAESIRAVGAAMGHAFSLDTIEEAVTLDGAAKHSGVLEERARIVAWLRKCSKDVAPLLGGAPRDASYDDVADDIEEGRHLE
jgi:hypothetical protein